MSIRSIILQITILYLLEYTVFVLDYFPYGVPYVLFVCAHIFVAVVVLAFAADKKYGTRELSAL